MSSSITVPFVAVLIPLLVRNHAIVKLMLTVQTRIYEITSCNEMIVLVMQNMEA